MRIFAAVVRQEIHKMHVLSFYMDSWVMSSRIRWQHKAQCCAMVWKRRKITCSWWFYSKTLKQTLLVLLGICSKGFLWIQTFFLEIGASSVCFGADQGCLEDPHPFIVIFYSNITWKLKFKMSDNIDILNSYWSSSVLNQKNNQFLPLVFVCLFFPVSATNVIWSVSKIYNI